MTEKLYIVYGDPPRIVSAEEPEGLWYDDDDDVAGACGLIPGERLDEREMVGLGISTTPEAAIILHLDRCEREDAQAHAAWQEARRALVAAMALQREHEGGKA